MLRAVLLAALALLPLVSPGPSAPADTAPAPPLNATALRSASEDRREWEECKKQRQCETATCSECGGDEDCGWMCLLNCRCGCLEEHRGGLDYGLWWECYEQRGCMAQDNACWDSCGSQECRDSCFMEEERCECECSWQQAGWTSTTSTTTTPSTTTPSTTSATTPTTPCPVNVCT